MAAQLEHVSCSDVLPQKWSRRSSQNRAQSDGLFLVESVSGPLAGAILAFMRFTCLPVHEPSDQTVRVELIRCAALQIGQPHGFVREN